MACGSAAAIWTTIALPRSLALGLLVAGAMWMRRSWIVAVLVLGGVAGLLAGAAADARAERTAAAWVPEGRVEMRAVALSDPFTGFTAVSLVRPTAVLAQGRWTPWDGPTLLLSEPPADLAVGEQVEVVGSIDPDVDSFRGRAVAGRISGRSRWIGSAPNPVLRIGNVLRAVVLGHLDEARHDPPGALLAGFLIGDTSRVPAADGRALRRAGLSHFVAVSGSNVALFLAAWWVVGGPLGLGARRRAVFGIVGVLVFAVVTRWEPSVVRASAMATLVLVGRWSGRPITPWTALGGAVGLSLLAAPELAGTAGFALSVAATAGIIGGAPVWTGRRPMAVWTVLGATISAQVAVAPLLLVWFGSVPLMAPLANLLAAPLVSASTALGGIGAVFGIGPLVDAGSWLAGVVLVIAHSTADLPQLGVAASLGLGVLGVLAVRARWLRVPALLTVLGLVVVSIVPPGPPGVPTVSFLDVGQGDATIFRGPAGEVVLVDGGPDPVLLQGHLRRFGIDRVDLLVVTHLHADHTTGLVGITGVAAVGAVWHPPQEGGGGPFDVLLDEVRAAGAVVTVPSQGDRATLGSLHVEVMAPRRRYDGPNDGSIVLVVSEPGGATVVMSGDVEVAAQRELGPLRGDILKVPHQGAATSDRDWLAASAPTVAVISVGPNDYGHPSPEVIAILEGEGAVVLRTDRDGTITLPIADAARHAVALTSGP